MFTIVEGNVGDCKWVVMGDKVEVWGRSLLIIWGWFGSTRQAALTKLLEVEVEEEAAAAGTTLEYGLAEFGPEL